MFKAKDAHLEQRKRLIQHAKDGRSLAEACDLEGCDPTQAKLHVKPLRFATGKAFSPKHISEKNMERLNYQFGIHLKELREHRHDTEVSQLVGLTRSEQARAVRNPPSHNWTMTQLYRLAAARDLQFFEMMEECIRKAEDEQRKLQGLFQ